MKTSHFTLFAGLVLAAAPSFAADLAVTGNLTVTGTIGAVGKIDSADNNFLFGTQGGLDAVSLTYVNNTTDTLQILINRNPASWLWVHKNAALNADVPAMRLDSAHQLILYNAAGTTAGVTLTPASNQLSLGTAILSGSGANLSTGGALTVASGITNTNGTLTGGASGLNLSSGTSGTNLTLTAAGAGDLVFNTNGLERMRIKSTGNVAIGASWADAKLKVTKASTYNADTTEGFSIADGTNVKMFFGADPTAGIGYIQTAWEGHSLAARNLALNPNGGNVGIGTTTPSSKVNMTGGNVQIGNYSVDRGIPLGVRIESAGPSFGVTRPASNVEALTIQVTGGNVPSVVANNADLNMGYGSTTAFGGGITVQNTTGNVGIGTTTPGAKLQIEGGSEIIRNNTAGNRLVWQRTDDTQITGFGSDGYSDLTLITNNSEKVRVTSAGNVGIGVTSPGEKLEVAGGIKTSGASPGTSRLVLQSTAPGGQQYEWYNDYSGAGGGVLGLYNRTSNNNPIAFTAGGNVGIGTTSPGAPLEIGTATGANFQTGIRLSKNGGYGQSDVQNYYTSGSNYGLAVNIGGAGNAQMVVNNSGNVGIGTTSPGTKLHVLASGFAGDGLKIEGNATNQYPALTFAANGSGSPRSWTMSVRGGSAGQFNLDDGTAGLTRLAIDSAGNVGIGTTSPGYKLNVGAVSLGEPTALKLDGGATAGIQIRVGDNYSGAFGTRYSGADTFISSNSYQSSINTDSWSKGVSTYGSTAAILGIAPNPASPAFQVKYSPANTATGAMGSFFNTDLLTILGNGNVGIGTTTPGTYKLAVNGTIHAKEIIVDNTNWADYVFKADYRLASLTEVEGVIQRDGHLPGIPSAQEIAEHGVSMGDMQAKLLSKIEELTLHMIQMEKENNALRQRVQKLEAANP